MQLGSLHVDDLATRNTPLLDTTLENQRKEILKVKVRHYVVRDSCRCCVMDCFSMTTHNTTKIYHM